MVSIGTRTGSPIGVQKGLELNPDAISPPWTAKRLGVAIMGYGITLAPCGLSIKSIETETDKLQIGATPVDTSAVCPLCGTRSTHIHSRYRRTVTDLPSQGRRLWCPSAPVAAVHRIARCPRDKMPRRIEVAVAGTEGAMLLRVGIAGLEVPARDGKIGKIGEFTRFGRAQFSGMVSAEVAGFGWRAS